MKVNVAYVVGGDTWVPCYVSIYSLLNNNKNIGFNIYLLSEERKNEDFFNNINFLNNVHDDISINHVKIPDGVYDRLPEFHWDTMSKGTNIKLLIGDYLPDKVDSVLLLDADTIILDNIAELLRRDISNCILAAAPGNSPRNIVGLGVPLIKRYFNAGVLYVNLELWRSYDVKTRAFDYIKENEPDLVEQTALNAVLHRLNMVKIISPKYNFIRSWGYGEGRKLEPILDPTEIKVMHYVGGRKPWHFKRQKKIYDQVWLDYYDQTPFTEFYPTEPAWVDMGVYIANSFPFLKSFANSFK